VGFPIVLRFTVLHDDMRTKHLFSLVEHAVLNTKMGLRRVIRKNAVNLVKVDARLPIALTKPDFHITNSQASGFHRFIG
jgi:hypothetical protein